MRRFSRSTGCLATCLPIRASVQRAMVLPILLGLALPALCDVPNGPPKARRDNLHETIHGVSIADPYRWLEDQKSPETRAWVEAESAYTQKFLDELPGRKLLRKRFAELLKIDTVSAPVACEGRYFFTKRLANQDLSIIYVRQGINGRDEVLVDPHPMSADHMVSVSMQDVTRDGKLLAYGVRHGGEDEVSVVFLDVDTRKPLADHLPRARYMGLSLKDDKSGVYYSIHEKAGPRVFYHAMGTDLSKDVLLFGKGYGPDKIVSAQLSENGKHLLYTVFYGSAARKTEVYYQPADVTAKIVPVVNQIEARFFGQFIGDRLYLLTNWNAPNQRVLEAHLDDLDPNHWREVIPTGKAVLQGFSAVGGKLFADYLENVKSRIKILDPEGRPLGDLELPGIGTISGVSGRWDNDEAFFSYTSFVVPPTIYRYNVADGARSIWSKMNVPIEPDKYEVKQVWYPSKDGTKIPMFLVYGKGMKLDGNNPTWLTAYGGFNISMTPTFSATAAMWVESGGVFAMPNLRGGGEFGEDWHRAGMLEKKQNVFDDFIAAAEWLISEHYTNPHKLAISGGSNGGLLVGAALTQRPDLYAAVVCSVPLLDMLRYQNFLVARFWVPEYGSAENAKQFKTLLAYSPYHNVKAGTKYPAVLFVSGDSDTRVAPLHARKMCALLQAETGSDKPVLLHYDMKTGHSAGKPINRQIDDQADIFSFVFKELNMNP
jgi:prolyl oligopeptidase